jgi:3',5'-cyclic AMP phosphodiesterase CpdA
VTSIDGIGRGFRSRPGDSSSWAKATGARRAHTREDAGKGSQLREEAGMTSRWGTMLAVLSAALVAATGATAAPRDTTVRTVQDTDGDNLLEPAPGEGHCVFGPGLEPPAGCPAADFSSRGPDSILHFLQLSDFQVVDEESPARVEAVDTTQRIPGASPFSAAYRPQESLTAHVTEAMVRQARNTTSPVTGERLDLAILTGDNADSQQHNETRWFIDILDGTTGPGNPDPEMDDRPGADRKVVPDSGRHDGAAEACGAGYQDNGSVYDGVRGGGGPGQDTGYYEPDGPEDGDGYTPDRERNLAETGSPQGDVTVRDFPGLFERAQEPFEAVGLGMPWYSAFGNHDALVQGNSPEAFAGPFGGSPELLNPSFDAIARGCVKPTRLPSGTSAGDIGDDPFAAVAGAETMIVPPDERRCFLAKDEPNTATAPCASGGWIQQHSRTTGEPRGHGFEPFTAGGQEGGGRPADARANHDGYYSFAPSPGVRFVVLDTITDECGLPVCAEGSVDHPQFTWLEGEIQAAAAAGEYVIVFSHHTLRTTRMFSTDLTEYPLHHGGIVDTEGTQPEGTSVGETLESLYCRYPNVVGHVNGHEHQNDVRPHDCEDAAVKVNPFIEISTAAHIDWPQQSRTIELVDDGGELSLVLTILDHAGPAQPGSGNASGEPMRLASIAREISYNDYQGSRGARGDRSDRNAVIPTGKPWPPSP